MEKMGVATCSTSLLRISWFCTLKRYCRIEIVGIVQRSIVNKVRERRGEEKEG